MSNRTAKPPQTDPLASTEVDGAGFMPPPAQPELPSGTRVGRYVILKKLGSGGMGIVYAAFDEELDRRVAVKFLQAALHGPAGSPAMLRLQREAQAMAKLSHPNVVAVFDVGTFEGQVFLAMELVEGLDLHAWTLAKRRTVHEIVSVFLQAGRGLQAAHAAGILHRDFKPDNAIVDLQGRVRVLDFGVARLDDTGSAPDVSVARLERASSPRLEVKLTADGALVGTPAYMAPEQLAGGRADARSDQFAFAATLFEALFGVRPFAGDTLDELRSNVTTGHLRAVPGTRRVPSKLRDILFRALKPDPAERFPDLGAMLSALEKQISVRRNVALGAAAMAAAAIAVAAFALRARPPAVCVGAEQEIAQTWSDSARAAVEGAIVASGSPRAHDVWTRVHAGLDGYAGAWAAMRTDSCQATRVRGVQSDESLDLRAACLDQLRRELGATVNLLRDVGSDAKLFDRALPMVENLTPISECADAGPLRASYAEPKDPAKRRAADDVRQELAESDALYKARQLDRAAEVIHAARNDARAIGSRGLEAAANLRLGYVLVGNGRYEEARGSLTDAAFEANTVRDDRTEAEAWATLVGVVGYSLNQSADAEFYGRLAVAALERAGSPPRLQAVLLRNRANIVYQRGDLDASLAMYREIVTLDRGAYGDGATPTARAEEDVADLELQQGHVHEALELYDSAIGKLTVNEGEGSAAQALALVNFSEALTTIDESARAEKSARRAIAGLHGGDVAYGIARMNLGIALLQLGKLDEAKAEERRAFAELAVTAPSTDKLRAYSEWAVALGSRHLCADAVVWATNAIDQPRADGIEASSLYQAQLVKSRCLTAAGQAKKGLALAIEARVAEEHAPSRIPDVTFLGFLAEGEAELGLHDPSRALAALEQGTIVADSVQGTNAERADLHLALARLLLAPTAPRRGAEGPSSPASRSPSDASRARALAERAAGEYEKSHQPAAAAAARALASGAPPP